MQGTVRKRNEGWQALLNVKDSKTKKRRQLSATFDTKAKAERWLAVTAGKYGFGEGAAHSMTVAELLDAWYERKSPDWSPSNRRNTKNAIERVLKPRFGDIPVLRLHASDLDEWYSSLRRSLSPSSIRKYHGMLHAAYALAERYDWVPSNPVRKAEPPKLLKPEITVPTLDELLLLTAACDDYDPRLGFAVYLAAATGARRGEVLALRFSDFDAERKVVRFSNAVILGENDKAVLKHGTKTGGERTVALDDATFERLERHRQWCEETATKATYSVQELAERLGVRPGLIYDQIRNGNLEATRMGRKVALSKATVERLLGTPIAKEPKVRLRDTAFLFSNDSDGSTPMSPDYLSNMYQKARKKAGLEHVKLHAMRHWHATTLLTQGVDVSTVAGRLGHAGGGRLTLSTYSHFIEPADRLAAEVAMRQLNRGAA